MAFYTRKIVKTKDGLYQPMNLRFEVGMTFVFLLAVAILIAFGKLPHRYMYLCSGLVLYQWILLLIQYRKFGPLGRPIVSVADNRLYVDRPIDFRGGVTLDLPELKQLIVYGPLTKRTYRFVKTNGTWIEAKPGWESDIERRVIEFLQQALPERLTAEEPQTAFANIRGDGPSTLS